MQAMDIHDARQKVSELAAELYRDAALDGTEQAARELLTRAGDALRDARMYPAASPTRQQIEEAHAGGFVLCKHTSPSQGRTYHLSLAEALEIHRTDPQLVWIMPPALAREKGLIA